VKFAGQLRDRDEALLATDLLCLVRLPGDMTGYKGEDLSACVVYAEKPWCADPALAIEQREQLVHAFGPWTLRAVNRVSTADHLVDETARQGHITHVAHDTDVIRRTTRRGA
jgi:hypothetical protein